MSNFKETLMKAKLGDKNAINKIVNTYNALILKKSIVDGEFDPDLRQYLYNTLLHCIHKFPI